MTVTRNTATHPPYTTYDVLVLSHAARCRYVPLDFAKLAFNRMCDEGADPILVAHLHRTKNPTR